MKGLFKKTVAGVMSVALLASMSAAALAHSEMYLPGTIPLTPKTPTGFTTRL